MPKKSVQQKVVYRIPPFVLFLMVLLCAAALYVVLYQQYLIDKMALEMRITILQGIPEVTPVPSVTPSPEYQMKLGY